MKLQTAEISKYVINGILATGVHYGVLTLNMGILEFKSAGLANLVAAIFGITASFLGSRYFVFDQSTGGIFQQAIKFGGLYGAIAVLHGLFLWVWSDWQGYDYRVGFLVATGMQFSFSYLGNKFLVFKI